MKRLAVLALGAVVGLSSCAMTPMVPKRLELCAYIRESVRNGSMPLKIALDFYAECSPTDAPR